MKKTLILLVLGFTTLIQAQNTISGTVTDKDKKPLQGVSIYIKEINKSTFSDANGRYRLANLPNNNISISTF